MGINVLDFKLKDKSHYEKIKEILGSDKFICFWVDGANTIKYNFGDLTSKDMAYIEKLMSMVTADTIKENTEMRIE